MQQALLLFIVIFPCLISYLIFYRRKLAFEPIIYLGAIGTLSATVYSSLVSTPLIVNFYSFPKATFGLSLDTLSGLVATVVMVIGSVVIRYSIRYLEDDVRQPKFLKMLALTLTSVLVMLMSANLAVFFVSWVSTSYFLHQLLIHFEDRPQAIEAATQKFWISRLGDLFLLSCFSLLYTIFKSLDFDVIFSLMNDPNFVENSKLPISVAGLLLILGAMSKSAQFPFHFWLPKTMETPTPVSALMHAGIINAGGYLVIRMSPMLIKLPLVLDLLALVGGFTAVFGSLIMIGQTDVKRSLAYSTISQMGFMMLECGLGAFSIATLHIIGHAFYKAYSFLSAGSVSDFGRINRYFSKSQRVESTLWKPFLSASFCTIILFYFGEILGSELYHRPGMALLTFILGLALAQTILSGASKVSSFGQALIIGSTYFILSKGMSILLTTIIPTQEAGFGLFDKIIFIIIGLMFFALFVVQNNLVWLSKTEFGQKLYVRVYNGFYFGK